MHDTNHQGRSLPALALTAALAFSTLGLAACNSPERAEGSASSGGSGSAQVAEETAEPEQQDAAAIEAYRDVLADVGSLPPFMEEGPSSPTGTYQYSIVTLQPGEGPSMLLGQEWSDGFVLVRVYYFDQESSMMYVTEDDYLISGVAMAGGYRGGMGLAADGNGLVQYDVMGGTGEADDTRYNREGNSLVESEHVDHTLGDGAGIDSVGIDWYDSNDTSALDAWENSEAEAATDEQEAEPEEDTSAAEAEAAIAEAQSRGLETYTGTLRVVDGQDLANEEGQPNYYSWFDEHGYAHSDYFVILYFDEQQTITASHDGGDGVTEVTVTTDMLALAEKSSGQYADNASVTERVSLGYDELAAYDGQRVTVAVSHPWSPSDASLPFGSPRTFIWEGTNGTAPEVIYVY